MLPLAIPTRQPAPGDCNKNRVPNAKKSKNHTLGSGAAYRKPICIKI